MAPCKVIMEWLSTVFPEVDQANGVDGPQNGVGGTSEAGVSGNSQAGVVSSFPAKVVKQKARARPVKKHRNRMLNAAPHGKYIAITERNQRESPLLRLPAEIRNRIFQFALGGRKITVETTGPRSSSTTTVRIEEATALTAKHPLALLSVCRQTYAESAFLPFTVNTFILFGCSKSLLKKQFMTYQLNSIRTLSCGNGLLRYTKVMRLAQQLRRGEFPALKTVIIRSVDPGRVTFAALNVEFAKERIAKALEGRDMKIIV